LSPVWFHIQEHHQAEIDIFMNLGPMADHWMAVLMALSSLSLLNSFRSDGLKQQHFAALQFSLRTS